MDKLYTVKSLLPNMTHNTLCKTDTKGTVDWFMEDANFWSSESGWDRYFTKQELYSLPPVLKRFVSSEFCEVREI